MGKKAKLLEIGAKIGAVTVVERVYNSVRKEWEYICECRCGNKFKSRRDHLLEPRKGCRACISKVNADIDLENTISEEEFNRVVEAKNSAKIEKRALVEKRKQERIWKRKQREAELEEKKRKFKNMLLTSPLWVGQKFGRLTVIDSYMKEHKTYWIMQCDCGNVIERVAKLVKNGSFISCGCISKEISASSVYDERLYAIWNGMKNRCLKHNSQNYHNYGGRGIEICDEWRKSYKIFREWAYQNGWTEEIPQEHKNSLSIERIDVNGNYEPTNCCFIPLWKQYENKRPYKQREKTKTWKDKTFIEIDGETKTYREWQEFYNFSDSVLNYRKKVVGLCGADLFKVKKHGKELYMSERKHF